MNRPTSAEIEPGSLFRFPKRNGWLAAIITGPLYAALFVLPIANIWYLASVGVFPILTILSIICSIAWLLLMAGISAAAVFYVGGLRNMAVHILGFVAGDHFAWFSPPEAGSSSLMISFRILGRRYDMLAVATEGIESVNWSMGQGSARAGRDIDDWHTALWFFTASATLIRSRPDPYLKGRDLHLFGPCGTRVKVENFARSFVSFLNDHGADLKLDTDRSEFTGGVQYSRTAKQPDTAGPDHLTKTPL